MFESKTELRETITKLESELKHLEDENELFNKAQVKHEEKIRELNTFHKRELSEIKKDHEFEMKELRRGEAQKVFQATEDLRNQNLNYEKENSKLKSENKILTKAFENMGFDVKDMKDILNKLADAVVAKQEVKLINASK